MTESEFQPRESTQPETVDSPPIIIGEARLIAALHWADPQPVTIPDEYIDEAKIIANDLLALAPPIQREAIKSWFEIGTGFDEQAKIRLRTRREYGRKRVETGLESIKKRFNLIRSDHPNQFLHQQFMDFSPVDEESIGRRLVGPTINRVLDDRIPNAPFDYSRLSDSARNDLLSHGQTAKFQRISLRLLAVYKDPGLAESTIEELKREIERQLQ